jgi:hypothetical protein
VSGANPETVARASFSFARNNVTFVGGWSAASASINRASMPLAWMTGSACDVYFVNTTIGVTPSLRDTPVDVVGTRGSPADAKFSPFVPSPLETE